MVRLLDDRFGGAHGVMNDEIRQVSVLQRHRAQEQRFFFSPNPKRHPAVVFNRYSRHGGFSMYTFKWYTKTETVSTVCVLITYMALPYWFLAKQWGPGRFPIRFRRVNRGSAHEVSVLGDETNAAVRAPY